ncbi:hypothetical protein HY485_00540 [Candidatus Woesearchaeota archaeon]|nr:hypothetical protein [Candidatus Woesearchaeota archaeon]
METEKVEKYFGKYNLQNPESEQYFSSVVAIAMRDYKLDVEDISHACGCSKPTVERWAKGINAPYHAIRHLVLECIVELIEKKPKQ